ncbi:unnamed protein product, partial [Nesidiocoris tenuis]
MRTKLPNCSTTPKLQIAWRSTQRELYKTMLCLRKRSIHLAEDLTAGKRTWASKSRQGSVSVGRLGRESAAFNFEPPVVSNRRPHQSTVNVHDSKDKLCAP